MLYTSRSDAGRRLGRAIATVLGPDDDVVVLGLPRGGVVTAAEVAAALHAPLDVAVVRKLGVPWRPELAFGAVGEDGVVVVDQATVRQAGLSPRQVDEVEHRERAEVQRRALLLRALRPAVPLSGRTVVIVDDGIATGATMRAACAVARARGAREVVAAAPVGPPGVESRFATVADRVVCPDQPAGFAAVGSYYRDFTQVDDEEVTRLLQAVAR